MFGISPGQLLIILVIVLLIFGGKRLRGLGGDVGTAIKGFKKAMSEESEEKKSEDDAKTLEKKQADEKTTDTESKTK